MKSKMTINIFKKISYKNITLILREAKYHEMGFMLEQDFLCCKENKVSKNARSR